MTFDPNQPPPVPPPTPSVNPRGRVVDPTATQEQRNYAMYMHLTLLAAVPLPVISIIAPIIMWQVRRDQSNFIDDHGREAVNFHLSLLLYAVIAWLTMVTCIGAVIGIPLLAFVYVLGLIGLILGATAAGRGEYYRYPATIRFIR